MCVALLGLFVALGGTTWAAVSLPAASVGTAQLRDRAVSVDKIRQEAVTGDKVKNHSLTGADIAGAVSLARHAASADAATHATSADSATRAIVADAAGSAYSTHFEQGLKVPAVPTVVVALRVPAGSYAVTAKGQVDTFSTSDLVECDLLAGADKDVGIVQGSASHQSQMLVNELVHAFATADTINLTCTGFLSSGTLSQVRLVAMQVGTVSTT
jgi:hypothetical protein